MNESVVRWRGPGVPAASRLTTKALAAVDTKIQVRAREVQGMAFVGQTALVGVACVSILEDEVAKLSPPGARLRLAAIGDATTAAIHARILNMMDGL